MVSEANKLSVVKQNVRKICASGKELREDVVFERVSGELAETFQAYLVTLVPASLNRYKNVVPVYP